MACRDDPCCSSTTPAAVLNSPRWRRALGIALAVNATFFVAEIVAAIMGGLGLWGGWQIVGQARGELRSEAAAPIGVAAE
jgi:hypothetical protein